MPLNSGVGRLEVIRKAFLMEFLGALGAAEVLWSSENSGSISGSVIYDQSDPDERQDFKWIATEADAPSFNVVQLASLLRNYHLLSIDKIKCSRSELRCKFCLEYGEVVSQSDFDQIIEELLAVEISMVDDGVETDVFFIHE